MNATDLPEGGGPTADPGTTPAGDAAAQFPATHRPAYANVDPKMVKLAAAALLASIVAGVLMFVSLSGSDPQPTTQSGGKPRIIEQPNSGKAPETSGDRGGSAQLILMGGLVIVVIGIGVAAMRSGSRNAKAGREAWREAGRSGRDGAVD